MRANKIPPPKADPPLAENPNSQLLNTCRTTVRHTSFGFWILSLGFIVLSLSASCIFAWTITPELKQEIIEKEAALEENPDSPMAHFDLAITYAYSNRIADGWEELKEVNKLDPKFAPEGLAIFQKKVAENPNDWKLRYRLAFAIYFNGKKNEAIQQFEDILQIIPNDPLVYGYIGLIQGEMDQVDTAIKTIKKAISIDSNIAALHLLLAAAYYKKNDSWAGFWEASEAVRLKALGF
jgi:tetratricopeptide (TPR) repeat protein